MVILPAHHLCSSQGDRGEAFEVEVRAADEVVAGVAEVGHSVDSHEVEVHPEVGEQVIKTRSIPCFLY